MAWAALCVTLLCAGLAAAAPVAPPAPLHNMQHRVNIHVDRANLKKCYDANRDMLACPLMRKIREAATARQVAPPDTKAAIDPLDKATVLKPLEGTGVMMEVPDGDWSFKAACTNYDDGLPLRRMYSLLRAMSKTSIVPNTYFRKKADAYPNVHQLDLFFVSVIYNVIGTGVTKATGAATKFFNTDFNNVEKDGSLNFDSKQLRAAIKAVIDDQTATFNDCRRVNYVLNSMEVARTVTLEQKKARLALISKIVKVVKGLLVAASAAVPIAGAAAGAVVGIVGSLIETQLDKFAAEAERKNAVMNILLALFKAFVAPTTPNGVPEQIEGLSKDLTSLKSDLASVKGDVGSVKGDVGVVKGDVGALKGDVGTIKGDVGAIKGDVGAVKGDVGVVKGDVGAVKGDVGSIKTEVGSVTQTVAAILGKVNTQSNGLNSQAKGKFRQRLTHAHRFAGGRKGYGVESFGYATDAECTIRVKEMLMLMHSMLEDPPQDADNPPKKPKDNGAPTPTWTVFESCVPTTSDGKEVDHGLAVRSMYKITKLFVEVPSDERVPPEPSKGLVDVLVEGTGELAKSVMETGGKANVKAGRGGWTEQQRDDKEKDDKFDKIYERATSTTP